MSELPDHIVKFNEKYGDLAQTHDLDFNWDALEDDEYDRLKRLELEVEYDPDNDPSGFSHLRNEVYVQMYGNFLARLTERPTPTQTELDMGAHEEEIEPQVRQAVLSLRAKGYNTSHSGFQGSVTYAASRGYAGNETQHISMRTLIPPTAVADLSAAGMTVTKDHNEALGDSTRIEFKPTSLDIESITARWQVIEALIPNLHKPADAEMTPMAQIFRDRIQSGESPYIYLSLWLDAYSLGNEKLAEALKELIADHPELAEVK